MRRHYKKVNEKTFTEMMYKRQNFIVTVDNDFNIGDLIVFDEFDNFSKATGNALTRTIIYIDRESEDGLTKGYCVLGLGH